jgi:hypothetical protein
VSAQTPPVPDLYCVNIQRYPRDLGVSIVLQATSELMARREVLRLFPEYTRSFVLMRVSLVRYVEFDWDAGRFTIAQREKRPDLPRSPTAEETAALRGSWRRGMTRIWERLFIGSIDDAEVLADDNPEGINTVIAICKVAVQHRRSDANYLYFPVESGSPVPIRAFYGIIDAIGENIRWGRILLHCNDGIRRAPAFAAAWMDVVGFANIDAALTEIRRVCPNISPSVVVVDSLRRHLK